MINCLDDMYYICDRELTCNGIMHYICTEASHSWVQVHGAVTHHPWWLMSRLDTLNEVQRSSVVRKI